MLRTDSTHEYPITSLYTWFRISDSIIIVRWFLKKYIYRKNTYKYYKNIKKNIYI